MSPPRKLFAPRYCAKAICERQLIRSVGETASNFARRRFCNKSCGCTIGNLSRGISREKREVPCSVPGCMAKLMRSVHISDAKCADCTRKDHRTRENAASAKHKIEARRYRIIMHAAGYSDEKFAEFMEELRKSDLCLRVKPEGWRAMLDVKMERRHIRGAA